MRFSLIKVYPNRDSNSGRMVCQVVQMFDRVSECFATLGTCVYYTCRVEKIDQ